MTSNKPSLRKLKIHMIEDQSHNLNRQIVMDLTVIPIANLSGVNCC